MTDLATQHKDKYHHGALREALIDEAFKVLEREGYEAISLRGLAEQIGVSKTAPYRHFEDKRSLLLVLASTGFRRLADALEARMRPTATMHEAVAVVTDLRRTYVGFSVESPALYKLMMSSFGFGLHSEECRIQSTRAFNCFIQGVAVAQAAGWKPGEDPRVLVISIWASMHGWAGLMLEKLIPDNLGMSYADLFDQSLDGTGI